MGVLRELTDLTWKLKRGLTKTTVGYKGAFVGPMLVWRRAIPKTLNPEPQTENPKLRAIASACF